MKWSKLCYIHYEYATMNPSTMYNYNVLIKTFLKRRGNDRPGGR